MSARVAVITGASAGIGAATAVRLAADGFDVILGARRVDALEAVAREAGGVAHQLDVTDPTSVAQFAAELPDTIHLLVNNAGGARGLEPISQTSDEDVDWTFQVNVVGLLRVTRLLLPHLLRSGSGHIVNLGSIAGREAYRGGSAYVASKFAVRAITQTLRLELMGQPVRITEVAPGLVETEFSLARFRGDAERARAPYRGLQPLTADDIADCISWVASRPPHVNIDEVVIKPLAQASATEAYRG